MKQVIYQGQSFEVPTWANYIATDRTGYVYVFDYEPTYNYHGELVGGGYRWKVGYLPLPAVQKI